jgi:hypothetical protein
VNADGTLIEDVHAQCLDLKAFVEDYYRIAISGQWRYWELASIAAGLWDMKEGLGGIDYFQAAFSSVEIHRERQWKSPSGNLAETSPGRPINIYNALFANSVVARWGIIHEFGHKFDFGRYSEIASGTPSLIENAQLVLNGLTLLTRPAVSSGDDWANLRPKGAVSAYAVEGGAGEDFAETWAAYHFQGDWASLTVDGNTYFHFEGFQARTPADSERQSLMSSAIAAFQSNVDWIQNPVYPLGPGH